MIDEKLLADWINALIVPSIIAKGTPFYPGPRKPEFGSGDFVGVVTPTLGPGLRREALWDMKGFQVEFTGRERDRAKVRQVIKIIDDALLFLDVPGTYWGVWVTSIDRPGSGPTLLQEDDHLRITYVATYFAEVAA